MQYATRIGTARMLAMVAGSACAAATAFGQDHPAILQWFEVDRGTIERRMPDFFRAGYGAVWLPPQSEASDPTSPGYDAFNRFDLGQPGFDQFGVSQETVYGTEADFDAMVEQFKRASGLVYIDIIMNHNSGRSANGGFIAAGGYPDFYLPAGGPNFWGDFNDGTTQSQGPCDPGYNLFDGDLVSLIDINVASNNWTVRQPIDDSLPQGVQPGPGDPARRIPEGTVRSRPDAGNARFYPDLSLPSFVIANPGFNRNGSGFGCGGCCFPQYPTSNTGAENTTFHPFNLSDPMAGDPVPENATSYLVRWTRWMLEVKRVDGFRLDAAKHMPQWFWDRYWDVGIHNRWLRPDGTYGTPFSFVEATSGNSDVYQQYVRKDGFANRDALDLSGSGTIRNIINAKGGGSAGSLSNDHIDSQDDGFNNGSLGVNHIYSHDNGSFDGGGGGPGIVYEDKMAPWAHAYLLLRTGPPIVYYNGREFAQFGSRGFWPDEGVPTALGYGTYNTLPGPVTVTEEDGRYIKLVQLRNRYARNFFLPKVQDGNVYAFERQGNCVVGVNDTYANGYDQRTFNTAFPAGTRLHELTGNAQDIEVDPANDIFDVVTVGAGGSVTIRVPRNGGAANEHNKGYVVYGPATPSGALSISNQWGVLPADSPATAPYARRLASIPVIKDATFTLSLQTSQTDGLDPNTDDRAIYRINGGHFDYNQNGDPNDDNSGEFAAYERFQTTYSPLFGGGTGTYAQTISTDLLKEGMNYISVIAFRHGGGASGDALYNEWREVVYVDRQAPPMSVEPVLNCLTGTGNLYIDNADGTVTRVHAFVDLAPGDPTPTLNGSNQAIAWDRSTWLLPVSGLTGEHTVRVVAIEQDGNTIIRQAESNIAFVIDDIAGDVDDSGTVDADDLYAFHALQSYVCRADLDDDTDNDATDRIALRALLGVNELTDMTTNR
jgi:hypothetical protein